MGSGENEDDREQRNALAARGYWQAYQAVRESVRKVLGSENPVTVSYDDHGDWFREMFGPNVTTGLLRTADLAGYRNEQVFIRRSMHVAPRYEAVRDCMPAFFDLLKKSRNHVCVLFWGTSCLYLSIRTWMAMAVLEDFL